KPLLVSGTSIVGSSRLIPEGRSSGTGRMEEAVMINSWISYCYPMGDLSPRQHRIRPMETRQPHFLGALMDGSSDVMQTATSFGSKRLEATTWIASFVWTGRQTGASSQESIPIAA